jgi:hypothetical protein
VLQFYTESRIKKERKEEEKEQCDGKSHENVFDCVRKDTSSSDFANKKCKESSTEQTERQRREKSTKEIEQTVQIR